MDVDDIRFKVAASRRIMFRADLDRDDVAGQVTARVTGEDAFWTTPLELFDETLPDHVRRLERTDPDLFAPTGIVAVNA